MVILYYGPLQVVLDLKGPNGLRVMRLKPPRKKIAQNCLARNLVRVHVKLKGIGYGKEAAIRGLQTSGLKITKIEDLTRIPFNGCRAKKSRRL